MDPKNVEEYITTRFILLEEWHDKLNRPGSSLNEINILNAEINTYLKEILSTNNPALMIAAEKSIVQNELERFANNKIMVNSYSTAVEDLSLIEKKFSLVYDQEKYMLIASAYEHRNNQSNGLPNDDVKRALASHYARLINLAKGYSIQSNVDLQTKRRELWKALNKIYIQAQKNTLKLIGWSNDAYKYKPSEEMPKKFGEIFSGSKPNSIKNNEGLKVSKIHDSKVNTQNRVIPSRKEAEKYLNSKDRKNDSEKNQENKDNKFRPY